VYINLLDAREPKLIFSNDQNNEKKLNNFKTPTKYCKKVIKLNKFELDNHKNFLTKEIKKNYF
jgi:DNA polymerase-3 subunit epsilon